MNRRQFLSLTGGAATVALAGCSDSDNPEENEEGAGGGAKADYEKSVNTVDGKTIVDLSLRAWFSCSLASPETTTFNINVIAAGETLVEDEWTVEFTECMVEHDEYRSYQLEEEYESVLVQISKQNN